MGVPQELTPVESQVIPEKQEIGSLGRYGACCTRGTLSPGILQWVGSGVRIGCGLSCCRCWWLEGSQQGALRGSLDSPSLHTILPCLRLRSWLSIPFHLPLRHGACSSHCNLCWSGTFWNSQPSEPPALMGSVPLYQCSEASRGWRRGLQTAVSEAILEVTIPTNAAWPATRRKWEALGE